jgi:hypothetical protein
MLEVPTIHPCFSRRPRAVPTARRNTAVTSFPRSRPAAIRCGLMAAIAVLTLALPPLAAYARDPDHPLKGRLNRCADKHTHGRMTSDCLAALLDNRETAAMIDAIPALRQGRLTVRDLEIAVARSEIGEPPLLLRDADANEADASAHVEADGRTPVFLSARELSSLESAEGFDVQAIELDPDFGPTELQNYPPPEPPDPFPLPPPGFSPPPPNPYTLDVAGFLDDFHAAISPNVNGYALKMRHKGATVGILQWNWARNPNVGDAPALGWNTERRMHVASVSKFMTAIGLIHLLEHTPGLDAYDVMFQALPAYWNRTAGSNEFITFSDLMNHVSGFSTGGSASDWQTMKSNVEAGVSFGAIGSPDYENMNFGLIRIMIATIGGYIAPATDFGSDLFNDLIWDAVTIAAYDDYMQTYVFNPVGAYPTLDTNLNTVLAYRFDGATAGWDSGDLSGSSGGFGWHMTIGEILDVARAFRTGQIVSLGGMSDILQESWGLNSPIGGESFAPIGTAYYKAGRWTTNLDPSLGRTEQCFLFMMPNEMELVVFVNSEISSQGTSLTNLVRTLFNNNIVGP